MNNLTNNSGDKKPKRDPEQRVAHMNSLFDRYVVPLVLFTLLVFVIFGVVVPAAKGCSSRSDNQSTGYSSGEFYVRRSALLDDIEGNREYFESCGYLVMNDDNGGTVAYRKTDAGNEIIDNVTDGNGSGYSAILGRNDYGESIEKNNVTIMLYSSNAILVMSEEKDGVHSAVFHDEKFSVVDSHPQSVSGGDTSASDTADQEAILELVGSERLLKLLDDYKQSLTDVIKLSHK